MWVTSHLMVKKLAQSANYKSISRATQEVPLELTLTGPQVLFYMPDEIFFYWTSALSSVLWHLLVLICFSALSVFPYGSQLKWKMFGDMLFVIVWYVSVLYWIVICTPFSILVTLTLAFDFRSALPISGKCNCLYQLSMWVLNFVDVVQFRWESKTIIKIEFKRTNVKWPLRGRTSCDQALKANSPWNSTGQHFSSGRRHRKKRQRWEWRFLN